MDYDNHPVQTRVHLQLVTHKYANGATQTIRGASTDVTTDASGRAQGSLPVTVAGSTEVEATATTPEQRTVFDSNFVWVIGGNEEGWGGEARAVQVIADKKSYAPGDTAHLSILSNVDSFHALVIATGYTVEFRKVMYSPGKSLTFDLPITTDAQPNLEVSVAFIRNDQLYQSTLSVKVPPVQEQIQIDITPDKQVFQPQQTAGYDVFARDWQGKPVSADFSFGVVDEAIYSLYPDNSGEIVRKLYPDRYVFAAVDSSLQYYFSGKAGLKSPLLATRQSRYRPQLAQVKPGNDVVQPRVRKAFPDTAYWSPSVAHRRGRSCARYAYLSRFAHHVADHGTCHHSRLQGRLCHQPRAGAQEHHRAYGHAALPAPGRRSHHPGDCSQLPRPGQAGAAVARHQWSRSDKRRLAVRHRAQQGRGHCALAGEGITYRHRAPACEGPHE